jgi:hypothetical protein
MKIFLTVFIYFIATTSFFAQGYPYTVGDYRYIIESVTINGKTNINRFTFEYDTSKSNFLEKEDSENCTHVQENVIKFDFLVKGFESNNKRMNHDFYDMLKSSVYPKIIVAIQQKEIKNIFYNRADNYLNLHLNMAGNHKVVPGKYSYQFLEGDKLKLQGGTQINLNDFSLEPPQKMLGLVQVDKTIFINFDIVLVQR